MPDISGAQVLAQIRQQPQLDSTRVVIHSGSAERLQFPANAAPDAVVAKAEGPVGLLGAVTRLI